jgi:hypothetical protein
MCHKVEYATLLSVNLFTQAILAQEGDLHT